MPDDPCPCPDSGGAGDEGDGDDDGDDNGDDGDDKCKGEARV